MEVDTFNARLMSKRVLYKNRKTSANGTLSADSLASLSGKKVDVTAARATVRHNRRVRKLTERGLNPEVVRFREEQKARILKSWWYTRRNWKSVKVGNRLGKQKMSRLAIEFPDGTTVMPRW